MLAVAASLLASAAPFAQSAAYHRKEMAQIATLKRAELDQSAAFAADDLRRDKDIFCKAYSHSLSLFTQSMRVQRDLARRETMRDVWQVRMQLNQTIIIITGLMFSCAFENLSQSTIPPKAASWTLYCLSGSTGIAIALLAASIWCCFKLQARIGGFVVGNREVVYTCKKTHANFNEYFDCHCESLRAASVILYYLGTVATLASAAAIQAPKYLTIFNDEAAAVLFAFFSLIVSGVFLIVGDWVWPGKTHEDTEDFGGLSAFGGDHGMLSHRTVIDGSPQKKPTPGNMQQQQRQQQRTEPFGE